MVKYQLWIEKDIIRNSKKEVADFLRDIAEHIDQGIEGGPLYPDENNSPSVPYWHLNETAEEFCDVCGAEIIDDDDWRDQAYECEDGTECACYECARKKSMETGQWVQRIGAFEEEYACKWCDNLYPRSELRKEVDMGYLCRDCIDALHSRGEKMYLEY